MEKIKVLEVNNIDLAGKRFNGYDMIDELSKEKFDIKQAVITKQSDNDRVLKMLENDQLLSAYYNLMSIEDYLSVHNIFSITTPALFDMEAYKEADIIHLHMFHNTKLSLYTLMEIAKEKHVVLSLHDPWFFTGHCVHFYECNKWQKGCQKCPDLKRTFPLNKDNCDILWNLKKFVFKNSNINIVVSTPWMKKLVEESPILKNQKNVTLIPFGIDWKKFSKINYKEARKHYGFADDEVVLFLRAQGEFKGTNYIVEALKKLKTDKKVTVLTCSEKNRFDSVKGKYKIIDLGEIKDAEMLMAMNACDIFLMPSIGESFGMMAIEAMSCKKPVIVFNNSALPSVTHAPEVGCLVKNKDAQDLEKAIKYLVENEKEREKRGKLGQKIVKEDYDLNKYNKSLEKLYTKVVKEDLTIKTKKSSTSEENIEKVKNQLNYITKKIFYGNKKYVSSLEYNLKGKYNLKDKVDYDNNEVEELIIKHFEKVYNILKNEEIKKTKLQKGLYLLRKNPKELFKIIYRKITRR